MDEFRPVKMFRRQYVCWLSVSGVQYILLPNMSMIRIHRLTGWLRNDVAWPSSVAASIATNTNNASRCVLWSSEPYLIR